MIKLFLAAQVLTIPDGVPVTDTYQASVAVAKPAPRLTVQHGKDDYRPVYLPPEKYRRLDRVDTTIVFVQDANSFEGCGAYGSWEVIACTTRKENTMIMPNPCQYPNENYARVLCHELGHVRGWDHDKNGKTLNTTKQKASNPSLTFHSP